MKQNLSNIFCIYLDRKKVKLYDIRHQFTCQELSFDTKNYLKNYKK